ncbi:hypothetical protein AB9E11_22190 [Rhizobium leguminosarum]
MPNFITEIDGSRHPFHAYTLQARRRPASRRDAWMARFDHRTDEDHRTPHRSDRTWRHCRGRFPPVIPSKSVRSRSRQNPLEWFNPNGRLEPVRTPTR